MSNSVNKKDANRKMFVYCSNALCKSNKLLMVYVQLNFRHDIIIKTIFTQFSSDCHIRQYINNNRLLFKNTALFVAKTLDAQDTAARTNSQPRNILRPQTLVSGFANKHYQRNLCCYTCNTTAPDPHH